MIVTHDDNGRPVDVGRGEVSAMPVPRRFADVDTGAIVDFGRGGVSAIPVPHHFADVSMGVEDSVEVCHRQWYWWETYIDVHDLGRYV